MTNALHRFLQSRNITVEQLQRKKVLVTIHNKHVEIGYLRAMVRNKDARMLPENIDQLDKTFRLTESERQDLLTMVKKKSKNS